MHNHNDNEKQNSSMMWMMLPCLLILVFAIFAGGGGLRSWPFLLIIGGMVVAYLWMMFRGHGSHGDDHTDNAESVSKKAEPTDHSKGNHSCCH